MELYQYLNIEVDLSRFTETHTNLDLDKEIYIACFVPIGLKFVRDISPRKAKLNINPKVDLSRESLRIQNSYNSEERGSSFNLQSNLNYTFSYLAFKPNGTLERTALKHKGRDISEYAIWSAYNACMNVFYTLEEAEAYYNQAKIDAENTLLSKCLQVKNDIDSIYLETKTKYNI